MAKYIHSGNFARRLCNFAAIDEHSVNAVISLLYREPAADVVEVVRCKNCIHKVDYCGRLMCGRNMYKFAEGVGGLVATLPEHFCSYGERSTQSG